MSCTLVIRRIGILHVNAAVIIALGQQFIGVLLVGFLNASVQQAQAADIAVAILGFVVPLTVERRSVDRVGLTYA